MLIAGEFGVVSTDNIVGVFKDKTVSEPGMYALSVYGSFYGGDERIFFVGYETEVDDILNQIQTHWYTKKVVWIPTTPMPMNTTDRQKKFFCLWKNEVFYIQETNSIRIFRGNGYEDYEHLFEHGKWVDSELEKALHIVGVPVEVVAELKTFRGYEDFESYKEWMAHYMRFGG